VLIEVGQAGMRRRRRRRRRRREHCPQECRAQHMFSMLPAAPKMCSAVQCSAARAMNACLLSKKILLMCH
jgi:hypothetical protein